MERINEKRIARRGDPLQICIFETASGLRRLLHFAPHIGHFPSAVAT